MCLVSLLAVTPQSEIYKSGAPFSANLRTPFSDAFAEYSDIHHRPMMDRCLEEPEKNTSQNVGP